MNHLIQYDVQPELTHPHSVNQHTETQWLLLSHQATVWTLDSCSTQTTGHSFDLGKGSTGASFRTNIANECGLIQFLVQENITQSHMWTRRDTGNITKVQTAGMVARPQERKDALLSHTPSYSRMHRNRFCNSSQILLPQCKKVDFKFMPFKTFWINGCKQKLQKFVQNNKHPSHRKMQQLSQTSCS